MRTFSKLRALCSHPELIEKPSARRDQAAAKGNELHGWVERWRNLDVLGEPVSFDGLSGEPRSWAERMKASWTLPEGLEVEVALGLAEAPQPFYVPVQERPPGSHNYEAMDGTKLLTAGRADLVWLSGDGDLVNVVDIKTGQFYLGAPSLLRQILAQAIAATMRADASGFTPGVYYARLGLFDWGDTIIRGSTEWGAAWAMVYEAAVQSSDPRPGGWCLSCWSRKDCRAYPGEAA